MTWRDIPGYEGLYCCSPDGSVKSLARTITRRDGCRKTIKERVLTPVKHTHGYRRVILCKNGERHQWLVHRLIALTYLPNPQGFPDVNHKNEDKADNRVDNLEWCTKAYNNAYGDRVSRIAAKHTGLRHSPETKRRMSEAHKNLSDDTRKKLSIASKGRKHSPQTRQKMSDYAKTRNRGSDGRWRSASL